MTENKELFKDGLCKWIRFCLKSSIFRSGSPFCSAKWIFCAILVKGIWEKPM